jgi:N-methylhydantoinase A
LSAVDAARGIVEVVNAAMAKGMHLMSVAKGRDPRDLGIVAFGGAGPAHACELADAIRCSEVIVPRLPGNTSAMGLALANVRRERSQAVLAPLAEIGDEEAGALLTVLARDVIHDLECDGVEPRDVVLVPTARISYEGQRYQIDVLLAQGETWRADVPERVPMKPAGELFRQRHLSAYGYTRDESLVLHSLIVGGVAAHEAASRSARPVVLPRNPPPTVPESFRQVWFGDDFYPTAVYERERVSVDGMIVGPAVVDQADSTTVIPPRWSGVTDSDGNLHLRREA